MTDVREPRTSDELQFDDAMADPAVTRPGGIGERAGELRELRTDSSATQLWLAQLGMRPAFDRACPSGPSGPNRTARRGRLGAPQPGPPGTRKAQFMIPVTLSKHSQQSYRDHEWRAQQARIPSNDCDEWYECAWPDGI